MPERTLGLVVGAVLPVMCAFCQPPAERLEMVGGRGSITDPYELWTLPAAPTCVPAMGLGAPRDQRRGPWSPAVFLEGRGQDPHDPSTTDSRLSYRTGASNFLRVCGPPERLYSAQIRWPVKCPFPARHMPLLTCLVDPRILQGVRSLGPAAESASRPGDPRGDL